jgi:hypothetical protein
MDGPDTYRFARQGIRQLSDLFRKITLAVGLFHHFIDTRHVPSPGYFDLSILSGSNLRADTAVGWS